MRSRRSLILLVLVGLPVVLAGLVVVILFGLEVLLDPGRLVPPGETSEPRPPDRQPPAAGPTPVAKSPPTTPSGADPETPDDLVWRGDARINGRIDDPETQKPAPGVTVELLSDRAVRGHDHRLRYPRLLTAVTDAQGRFRFEGVARRMCRIRVSAPNRRTQVHTVRRPRGPDRDDALVVFALGLDTRVRFVVEDADQKPIPGASLVEESLRLEIVDTQPTDSQGRTRWSPQSEVRVWFRAPGYADRLVTDWRRGYETRVVLAAGHAISGTVITGDGTPVEGVAVAIAEILTAGRSVALTDRQGAFRFVGLPESARVRLTVREDGYLPTAVEASTGRGDVGIVLQTQLEPGGVSGVVLRPDGAPAAGVLVNLRARTDAGGRFVLDRLQPGGQHISARTDEIPGAPEGSPRYFREMGSLRVDVKPGEILSGAVLRLEAVPISFLPVLVVDERGRPRAAIEVSAPDGFAVRTDAEGRALLHVGLPPNSTVLVDVGAASARQLHLVTRAEIEGDPHRIALHRAAVLQLTLKGAEPGARVWVVRRRDGHSLGAVESTPGVFEMNALPGVPLIATVRHGERLSTRLIDDHGNDGAGRKQTLDLAQGASLRLTVRNRDGTVPQRIAPYVALAHPDACRRRMIAQLKYVQPGTFEAGDLPAGRVELLIYVDRRLVQIEEIELAERARRDLTVRLRPPLAVRGQVRDGASGPLGGARVELLLSGGIPEIRPMGPLAASGSDGSWSARVPDLANSRIAIAREGRASVLLPVDVSLSARASVVSLPEEGVVRVRAGEAGAFLMYARLRSTTFRWLPESETEYTEEAGITVRVRRLPIGNVELGFERAGGDLLVRTVRVEAGVTTELDLTDAK